MLLQIHRWGESYCVFVVEIAPVVITALYLGLLAGGQPYIHSLTFLSWVYVQAQIVSILRSELLQPNDSDLTGFRQPTGIFFEHFLCCARRQTICLQGGYVQIKACYPLLRGRLHIMMKGLALSSCERITHCCGGRKSPPIFWLFLCIRYKMCCDWGARWLGPHWS